MHHDTYWSIPKSPLHTMTFLHFYDSVNMASLQSKIFSQFSFHLRNMWYKLSFTVQSIFDPSIYGINIGRIKYYGTLVAGWEHCGLCTSISTSELEESWEIIELFGLTLVSITWAEFFAAPGILGLWKLGHRPLSSRNNKIKYYISVTSWKQACKLQITVMTLETLDYTWAGFLHCTLQLQHSGTLILQPHPHETCKVLICASCKQI